MHFDVTLIGARDFAKMFDKAHVYVPDNPTLHELDELKCSALYLYAALLLKLVKYFSSQR